MLSREQLRALGATAQAVDTRLTNGRLHALHRGVYVVGHTAGAPGAQELAAVLACGEGAVVSHRSALHLWGLVSTPPRRVHVTVPRLWKARHPGIAVHSTATLQAFDLARSQGIPLTRPARALVMSPRQAASTSSSSSPAPPSPVIW